jgi:branched-chain amino acid transport system permease protein
MQPITIRQNGSLHWALRLAGLALLALIVLYIPTRMPDARVELATTMAVYAIAATSVNLVLGYGGQISIGQSAFFGLGVYTTAILVADHGWSPLWTIPASVVVAFVAGCLVALPALRFKGVYLALVTLSLAVLFPVLLRWRKLEWLTGGTRGIDEGTYSKRLMKWPILGRLVGQQQLVFYYWLAVIVLVVSFIVCRGIVRSRTGRSLIAIRDNETAAAVMGVNLVRTKTLMFGIAAAIAAAAGSVSVMRSGSAKPDTPTITLFGAIIFLLIMFLGGAASLWGPIVGAVAYVWVDDATRQAGTEKEGVVGWLFGWANQSPATMILAAVIIVVVFVAPHGIAGLIKQLTRKIVVVVPESVGTSAPASPAPAGDVVPQATT